MANWIVNKVTLHGDAALIQNICETHFAITPPSDPEELDRILAFPGVIYDNDAILVLDSKHNDFVQCCGFSGEYNFGFHRLFGRTSDEAHGGMPGPRWQGEYGSPFHVEWCSKWYPNLSMMCGLGVQYPDIKVEYLWYDILAGTVGRNVWEHGAMILEQYNGGGRSSDDLGEEAKFDDENDDVGFGILDDDGAMTEII